MSRRTPRVPALHLHAEGSSRRAAPVLSEEPLEIRLIDGPRYRLPRTPGNDIELAHGLLYAEGLITRAEDLSEARYCAGAEGENQCNTYNVLDLRLNPQVGPPPEVERTGASISTTEVRALLEATPVAQPDDLYQASAMREGHTTHREDLAAINAVDKVMGALLVAEPAAQRPARGAFLLLSARPTLDVLRRAQRAGFRGVSSPLTPTGAAVEHAREHGLILLCCKNTALLYSGDLHE
ncbi:MULTISPECIES: formate dehydrogenase accessory sulfurtransferase FdhD [unclassified Corynebacterium]|uniref:formate dehydrogenase accessory sulfurtransferase FdhD n=1 Tax=unclassified Corynebacterium TaxID=2624378 RepID=UPI0029CA882A|nr:MULTISPECIES: formate dehydrogenase accessory sulfurtransferase FdhD [unclassified Corynebacterium]WPF66497.1 formate dehydrogenase accessory sulfurtransferase FdhD [Corynebacterium sp. 22KM0430]WPF68986.1 formate dehydrogenase accessory sulfurtransferase FdhD [Corynebacterium sp. 21KM1197]